MPFPAGSPNLDINEPNSVLRASDTISNLKSVCQTKYSLINLIDGKGEIASCCSQEHF